MSQSGSPPTRSLRRYRLGDLILDTGQRRVTRDGQALRLGKLTLHLLETLAEAAPSLVTKDELAERIWSGRYVSPETVSQRVKLLRDALGDDAQAPRYIEVIRGQGYRLMPNVERLPDELPADMPGPRRAWRRVMLATVAILVVALALSYPYWFAERQPSIAVLPFVSLSTDPQDALLVAGIHSELLTTLTKIRGLKTIYLTSVLQYRADADSPQEIGRALGVDTVLVGDFRRVGDAVRINVRLIDTESGEQLWAWASPQDEPLGDELELAFQAKIATAIASRLEVALSPEEATRVALLSTHDPEAQSLYLAAKSYDAKLSGFGFGKGPDDGERHVKQLRIEQYEKATRKDDNFALAWAALADARADYAGESDDPEAMRHSARVAAARALELAPDLPEAHVGMGRVLASERQYAKALEEYALAEQGMPGNADVYKQRALTLRRSGDYRNAVVDFRRAIELDPADHFSRHQLALSYARLRDYDAAERTFDALLNLYPEHGISYDWKVDIPKYRGDLEGMRDAIDEVVARTADVFPGNRTFWRNREKLWRWEVAFRERDYSTALAYLETWESQEQEVAERANDASRVAELVGLTYLQMGDRSRAEEQFMRAHATVLNASADGSPWALARLAAITGYLGDAEKATDLARQALDRLPEATTGFDAHWLHIRIIWALIAAEQYDWAFEELEKYLAAPGAWTIEGLLLDPRLDPLRDDPRLKALEREFGRECWVCLPIRFRQG